MVGRLTYAVQHYSVDKQELSPREDFLAQEEALQIYVIYGAVDQRRKEHWATLMRTPTADYYLILGLLYSEGIIQSLGELQRIVPLAKSSPERSSNLWKVELSPECGYSPEQHRRNLLTSIKLRSL